MIGKRILRTLIVSRSFSTKIDNKLKILKVRARQVFDSRGIPTVEAEVWTDIGFCRAIVPSGASTGVHEAKELRDEVKHEFHGKGVLRAVGNVNTEIGPKLIEKGFSPDQQFEIDKFMNELDGTEDKSKFGANAILAVSMAVCRAGAAQKGIPLYKHIAELVGNQDFILPVPAMNVINGGKHAGNKLAMQEFMIMPTGAKCFAEAMKMGTEIYHNLKKIISKKFGKAGTLVGDEGGFAPDISDPRDAILLIQEAVKKSDYCGKVFIAMDPASSEFHKDEKYNLDFKNPKPDPKKNLDVDQMIKLYTELVDDFSIVSIEDPFEQDDFEAWEKFTSSTTIQVVGDDLLVTNPKRMEKAHLCKACNALLLKVNQIGTITESLDAYKLAKKYTWGIMVSHRSGETEDPFIADLTVGLGTGQIKSGAPCRSSRLAKYNRILRIEEELEFKAKYVGTHFRQPWLAKL